MSDLQLEKLLTGILSRLSVIEQRLTTLEDHEARLRDLEKNRYQNAWVLTLGGVVLTAVIVLGITTGAN
jgi:hypothetical protein